MPMDLKPDTHNRVLRPHLAQTGAPVPFWPLRAAPTVHCPTCGRPADYVYAFGSGRGGVGSPRIVCPVCDLIAA